MIIKIHEEFLFIDELLNNFILICSRIDVTEMKALIEKKIKEKWSVE